MDNFLSISVSASLALHAMSYISANPNRLITTKDISSAICASEAHLHKVLQRLVKTGIVKSTRGPRGGFKLKMPIGEIRLLDVFQAIEGPFKSDNCLMETSVCKSNKCIFGDVIKIVNNQVFSYLSQTKLSQISDVFDVADLTYHEELPE